MCWTAFSSDGNELPPPESGMSPIYFQATFRIRRVRREWVLPSGQYASKRDQNILNLYKDGCTLSAIAQQFGISVQRVHQIVGQR
jgi:hypothetical protein